MISDFDKTSELILSDSAFETLTFVETQIAAVEAELAELRKDAKLLKWDSFEYRYNYEGQREAQGQLLALAGVQGYLQGITKVKCILADCRRSQEAPKEVE